MRFLIVLLLLPALLTGGVAYAGCPDGDGDGYSDSSCGGDDCNDDDPNIHPGASETCDGIDSDCDGLGDGEDLDVGAVPGPPVASSSVPFISIQDNTTVSDSLTVSGAAGPLTDVDATIWLLPDFAMDLVVTLTSPAGTSVILVSGVGEIGDDFDQTIFDDEASVAIEDGVGDFVGSYIPTEALSAFDGEDPNGTWTLDVADTVPNFSGGIFNSWGIELDVLQPDDADGDGWVDSCPVLGDCDPTDPGINPGALELCNDGIDQDCDGSDTDGDFDGDGLVDDSDSDGSDFCSDCDDQDPGRFPGNPELCEDGIDQDCSGDDLPFDADGDGSLNQACGGDDCDDSDPAAAPGLDADLDGVDSCDDCDDAQVLNYPGNTEDCDGLDNDCDGLTDEDDDGDGSAVCLDCDDANPEAYPGAPETCGDGIDQDCDGLDTEDDIDADGFSSTTCGGEDCNDADSSFFPGAPEICDGQDRNCDGESEAVDEDEDSHFDENCGGDDCDDSMQGVHPNSFESCNGVDDDCDGLVDEDLDCGDDDDSAADDDDDDDDSSEPAEPYQPCDCSGSSLSGDFGGRLLPSGLLASVLVALGLGRRRRSPGRS